MLAKRISGIFLAAGAFLCALPAYAAEEHAADTGLPQFDPTLFPEQLFWLVISFALLYFLMAKVALPNVRRTQDKRSGIIAGELAAAQKANDAAKAMMAEYEKALSDARAQAQATVAAITAQAAKESAARQSEQQQFLAKHLADVEAKIVAARDSAIKEASSSALSLAEMIVEKIMGLKSSPVRSAGDQ